MEAEKKALDDDTKDYSNDADKEHGVDDEHDDDTGFKPAM